MRLEVISREPKGAARPTPLLFVHGAYGGAWEWAEHFMPFFAERGWTTHAVSLRGHGESDGAQEVWLARLADYIADVEQVVADLPAPPVLIGHSLGGMVVQKCLHRASYPGAVLMASAPPHGMFPSLVNMAFANPGLLFELTRVQAMGPRASGGQHVRRALFSEDAPQAAVRRYMSTFQSESLLVTFDLLGLDLPPSTPSLDLPVLVLGAENDTFVFPGALHATAQTYRTQAEILPGMAHAMMLDLGWEEVAQRIARWLETMLEEPAPKAMRRLSGPATSRRKPVDAPFA